MDSLSLKEARRIALAAQGFARPRPETVDRGHLRRLLDRLALHQIDSVNVLIRAHYLPAFSRLGDYDRGLIDRSAWGRQSDRRLFEYWAHEASLLPLDMHPLLRWRMAAADRGELGWKSLRAFAAERRSVAEALLARIKADGPMAASDFEEGRSRSGWWAWGETKVALEWLFWAGHVTTATRRGSFERVYDLTERVFPESILALPTPDPSCARRALIERAARALGIGTSGELRDYFRLSPSAASQAVAELVEAKVLFPVRICGQHGVHYLHRDAQRARKFSGQALIAPFDPLIWNRDRTERLFGFRYRLEIYTPEEKRLHGYYVLPFLLGDRLVARVDLKADRQRSRLIVRRTSLEPNAPSDARDRLELELKLMAKWLGLANVENADQARSTSATLS